MNKTDFSDLLTLRDWIRFGSSWFNEAGLFYGHGTDNAWDEALVICLWAIHQPWESIERIVDTRLTMEEKERIALLFERRVKERIPAAYLTGEAWFAGFRFRVNKEVLVPRSPIAELILQGFEPWITDYPHRILDMCTGSGCIGIASARLFDQAQVDLVDISESALAVSKQNIELHDLQDRVTAIQSDGFANLTGKTYDLILSNPPYVDEFDLRSMPREFHAEPEIGLGSGQDGLDFTRHLLGQAASHLSENGVLIAEVGNSWTTLEEAFPDIPFMWVELENGGHGVFVLTRDQLPKNL